MLRPLLSAVAALAVVAPTVVIAQAPPAPPVSVAKPVSRPVVDWVEFPGRFEPAAYVEVRAQVAGELAQVAFTDGQEVKAGDLLFKIDDKAFVATLRQTEAAVVGNQTRLDLATAELKRAQELRQTGNIPEQTFQQRQQTFLESQANLNASTAEAETARINLGYTQIRAPISGRIGRKLVTEGNLISAGSSGTLLTTIVAFDPVDFYFDVDEGSFLAYTRSRANKAISSEGGQKAYIALSDETEFTREGTIDFLGNQVDAQTGTIRVRASVPNPDHFITPGLFGRVRLATRSAYDALILPDEAIILDQTRHLVMTVSADGTVVPKPIEIGPKIGQWRAITGGVTADDTIIVNGLMRARPGAKVTPQPTELKVPDDLTRPSVTPAN